jgi:hypothetical protein
MKAFELTSDQQLRAIALIFDRWTCSDEPQKEMAALADIHAILYWSYQKRVAKALVRDLEAYDARRGKVSA